MISKSLVKLIDEAIMPAMLLIIAKLSGLFLSAYFLNLDFTFAQKSFLYILPALTFVNSAGYTIAENYSNLAMFLATAAGTIYILVRAHFFHQSHIHPGLSVKLHKLNLQSLISPTYHLYHQAAIWLLFLWLTVAYLGFSTLINVTYPQISIIAFVVAANFSWVFAIDVEKEIEISTLK